MRKFTQSLFLYTLLMVASVAFAQNATRTITQELAKLVQSDQLLQADTQWELTSEHTSRTSGIHHAYYRQTVNGIHVMSTQSGVHILQDGTIISANNRFVNKTQSKVVGGVIPSLSASQAVTAAADQLGYSITQSFSILENSGGVSQQTLLSDGGISLSPIPAKLMYQNINDKLILVWDISIQEIAQQHWWNVRVDASTGTILDRHDWMVRCSFEHDHSTHEKGLDYNANLYDIPNYKEAKINADSGCGECYEVIAVPIESPYYGPRTTEMSPSNATASPFGWHDTDGVAGAEFTVTRGNNVNAYEDGDNPGFQPDGGATLDFTGFPFDQVYTNANQYESAAITNLFYWNNTFHDMLYIYGFDEVGGNFQENNYGNGAAGSDSVNAEAQDGSGTCNANMGTPPDGQNPRMQMYVCNDKDGDFDNLVIVHEYGHGVSNRLTGGPTNTSCLNNSEQMGEGWSDFYGVLMTIQAGDTGTDARGVGTYLFGQGAGGAGIRPFPYSTDMGVNPQTYNSIQSAAVPHGVGSVWATMLWEVTWELIDEHGFDPDFYNFTGDVNQDAGNIQAWALVTEGLKLQPCSPGFVDGRDAILAADAAIYGGANECRIWEAFARRGLGFSANQGSSGSTGDGMEAFDSPTTQLATAEEVCVSEGTQTYGGGTPVGGVYSGPGVTDDGNGLTYTFDPAVAGIGTHTITYEAVSMCGDPIDTDTIEVTTDIPEITCQNVTLELDANGEATLTMFDVVTNLEPGGLIVDQTGTFAPIDITATGTGVSLTDDDVSGALPVGFSFDFYGQTYSDFYISSNGFITFNNDGDNGCCSGDLIPSAGTPNNFIAFAWEDLNPASGGSIRYETVGTAPDRKLVVEFDDVPFFGTSNGVTSQVHLFEGSNRIEIHSTSIPADGTATQGIENANGSEGLATPGRNDAVWSATNDYVAFYETPPSPADNCGSMTTIELSQTLFTCLDLGTNAITVTITDGNGNSGTCTPNITVLDPLMVCILGTDDSLFSQNVRLFPNPTNGQLTLINNSTEILTSATITDVNGRIIRTIDLNGVTTETNFSIENLSQGMYFMKIQSENGSIVKRIVKE